MSPVELSLAMVGGCFLGSIVPVINTELVVLAAAAAAPAEMVIPLIILASVAQMTGKAFLYFAGTGLINLPAGRMADRVENAIKKVESQKNARRVTLFASASTGFPPFYVMSIASGALRMDFKQFIIIGLVGRTIRTAAIVMVPQFIKHTMLAMGS